MSRASVSEGQVDKKQTSALVLLLDVLIHENENRLFLISTMADDCHAYAKARMRFAIGCKSSGLLRKSFSKHHGHKSDVSCKLFLAD